MTNTLKHLSLLTRMENSGLKSRLTGKFPEDALDQAQTELDQAKEETLNAQQTQEALLALYQLQQQYSAGDMDGCLETLQRMDDEGLVDLLPDDRPEGVTSPADRYQQLKEAVLNH